MPSRESNVTQLLHQWRDGSAEAENQLFELVNADLRHLAQYFVKGEGGGGSIQATELVDQIYIRLVAAKDRDWQSRQHFFAIAARTMRRHLIDLARGRPSAASIALETIGTYLPASSAKLDLAITVDRLLNQLGKHRSDWCTLVELKYFLGLTDEEVAEVMGVKLRTAQRMWRDARQWLYEQTEGGRAASNAS